MATEIKVPALGESVTEATVSKWLKNVGDAVGVDEPLVELETDKVTMEVNATTAGVLAAISAAEGTDVEVGAVLGAIDESASAADAPAPAKAAPAPEAAPAKAAPAPVAAAASAAPTPAAPTPAPAPAPAAAAPGLSPAVRRLVEENGLDASVIPASGKDGRLVKGDVLTYLENRPSPAPAPAPAPASGQKTPAAPAPAAPAPKAVAPSASYPPRPDAPREERVGMSRLRRRVAERLKEAQNSAAMLTTFNEVDMTEVLAMRKRIRDQFEKKHGVKLGFMSIFAKACVVALREFPAINAEIEGTDILYKNYYDIGIAVGTENGLVVPVVRDVDAQSFAQIEQTIADYGRRAREGRLTIDEMTGGTFTITNGGVFGSLLSTPILNAPQSGILGMHKTQMRPMVMPDGSIEARPMMYLALSYDHRIVDGREAVSFLVRVKESLEDPQRIMLDA
ncbi:2-oxoglutarate dehydrogenase E2 component [Varunaivibrio sulfuroxidans]|uniref:Dihydrolipoyllysine-residue succinyltransferase component of 2-oxoglutarate dehydrogenase complex n=1 Tax=Varunaivibrio sulfuroxidans TaxID=1773489 RepID=A0A4R3JC32_9PROT|nr:2-oxoglutarate dehydrogenase complex dihydrolipoyllysine-residue succinyltransferase [Varunaivibrio sulfuroxidans]TCS63599.1 2-oxoglutarate dehydrogenase E2 component [Varunaivibrio sulfuroxidans]